MDGLVTSPVTEAHKSELSSVPNDTEDEGEQTIVDKTIVQDEALTRLDSRKDTPAVSNKKVLSSEISLSVAETQVEHTPITTNKMEIDTLEEYAQSSPAAMEKDISANMSITNKKGDGSHLGAKISSSDKMDVDYPTSPANSSVVSDKNAEATEGNLAPATIDKDNAETKAMTAASENGLRAIPFLPQTVEDIYAWRAVHPCPSSQCFRKVLGIARSASGLRKAMGGL
jgi:hypothetical protein